MEYIFPTKIEDYAAKHSSPEPAILQELQRETFLKVLHPRMLSGHVQGRFLSLLSHLQHPQNILEIGTYTGYSALCLAEGMKPTGKLFTIDCNDELRPIQDKYFEKAGMKDRIINLFGNAIDLIPKLAEYQWDIVFIDADKSNYGQYLELVRENIRPGGLLIADNVLWSGKVTEKADANDPDTLALQNFSSALAKDTAFETIMLTIRDGLTVARKR